MAVRCKYTSPKRDAAAALTVALPAAEHAAGDVLLSASQALVPVEEGVLKASGRVVRTPTGVAVTYGRDDDGDYEVTDFEADGAANGRERHAPSNQYVIIVHEDLTAHHPRGGQAHFLLQPAHAEGRAMVAACAVSLRKALR